MNDNDVVELKTPGLDKLIRALNARPPSARVGILGNNSARSGRTTNATVGAAHEFGTSVLPQRSFLRVPISEHLESYLKKSGALNKETFKEVIASGTVTPWMEKVAIVAESIVLDAFDSGGFGKWKSSNMDHKKNKQTLVETGQLRNSITSEVK